jgi:hypothetical protein
LVIALVIILNLGLAYFAYNFYVCHKKKINIGHDDEEIDDKQIEF